MLNETASRMQNPTFLSNVMERIGEWSTQPPPQKLPIQQLIPMGVSIVALVIGMSLPFHLFQPKVHAVHVDSKSAIEWGWLDAPMTDSFDENTRRTPMPQPLQPSLMFAAAAEGGPNDQSKNQGIGGVRGRVVDETGAPLPGIEAVISLQNEQGAFSTTHEFTASTDGEGQFQLKGLPVGRQAKVHVRPMTSDYAEWGLSREFTVSEDLQNVGTIILPRTKRYLAGRITNPDGTSAQGVLVTVNGGWSGHRQLPGFMRSLEQPALELSVGEWVNSEPIKLSTLRGKYVVLFFNDSGLLHALRYFRGLAALQEKAGNQLAVITIQSPYSSQEVLQQFSRSQEIQLPIAIDQKIDGKRDGRTYLLYNTPQFPLVLVDSSGLLVGQYLTVSDVEIELGKRGVRN